MIKPYHLTLTNVYAVSCVSPDDGHNVYYAYFSTEELAKKYLNSHFPEAGHVVKTELYVNLHSGEFYDITIREMDVDMPDKSQVLKQLTNKEKKVLGLI